MSTTSSNVAIGGTLTVTGATTLSSTLSVTGAATLSSTLAVTGAVTASDDVSVGGDLNVTGTAEITAAMYGVLDSDSDIDDYATTYTWAQLDGTNPLTVPSIRMYDHGTNAYRVCYLLSGTLTII